MSIWIAAIVVGLLIATVGVLVYTRRRSAAESPAAEISSPPDLLERQTQRQALVVHGNELLERRVNLDSRRGALTGDDDVFAALVSVQDRYQRGEITEIEYEAEKIRLLGG